MGKTMGNRKQSNGTEARHFFELLPSQYLAPLRMGMGSIGGPAAGKLGLTDVPVEHGSERGSCLAVEPLKRIHQDVVVGEACIYKQLGGMSVEWRAPRRTTNAGTCFFFAPGLRMRY